MLIAATCAATIVIAQQPSLKLHISQDHLQPGDTLDLEADYTLDNRKLPPATFAITLQSEDKKVWQMRWPMVDGHAEASIVIPHSMPAGLFTMAFAVQPRFLKFYGQVVYPPKLKLLSAVVSSRQSSRLYAYVPDEMGRFTMEDLLFEDTVKCRFSLGASSQEIPMVLLDAWLDSSFLPASYGVKSIVVNDSAAADAFETITLTKNEFFKDGFQCFQTNYPAQLKLEQWKNLSPVAFFDSMYVPLLFKGRDAKTLDCITDSSNLSFAATFDMLKKKMPDMEIKDWELDDAYLRNYSVKGNDLGPRNERMIFYEKNWYRIYCNGSYGDLTPLMRRPDCFALVRILPPPFYKHPRSEETFGVIAFFERKYPFASPEPFGNSFLLRGYTPALYVLPTR